MTLTTFMRVNVCTVALWPITGLSCGIPAILIGTIAPRKAELADPFLYLLLPQLYIYQQ